MANEKEMGINFLYKYKIYILLQLVSFNHYSFVQWGELKERLRNY